MNPPSSLSPSAQRWLASLTGAALAGILGVAAWARFDLPPVPVADSDTWGYLHPALARLTGSGFVHTAGRNFVYPGWIYFLLRCFGDFRAITVAQHLLGLASGGLLWVCWRQWRGWFSEPHLPAWADALCGLGLVAFFEQSASVITFEHTIRPEAVFPFFALLDLILLLAFLRAWFVERRWCRAAWLASGELFVAALLYQLKPSFGLALAVAAAPMFAALLLPWRQEGRPRGMLAGAVVGAAVLAAVLFLWPEHRLARGDAMSTLFLPETLLTIHADLIRDQIDADTRAHAATPYDAPWLAATHAALARELRLAAAPIRRPYRTLGFNPDYLMYNRHSFCAWLGAQLEPVQVAQFASYYYRRVWTHQPVRMLAKVARQLGVFYSLHCPAFYPGKTLGMDEFYRKSSVAFDYANYQRDLSLYPPARGYLDAIRQLAASHDAFPQSPLMIGANVAASVGAFPLLLLFGAGMVAAGLARAGVWDAPAVARLFAPGGVLMIFYGFTAGNTLTIAIVHSLNIDRYSTNLLVFCAPALVGTLVWLAEFSLALRVRPNTFLAGC